METIKITLEIPLTEELLRRVDAAAKWMETTRQDFIKQALDTGVLYSIEKGLTITERLMLQYPGRTAALEAIKKGERVTGQLA